MKAIIDCGGWRADSITPLRKVFGDCIVHSFECNPIFFSYYKNLENVILHKEAVWIYDGKLSFHIQKNPEWEGHSVFKDINPERLSKKKITVPCIDFSYWILKNFKKEDELYLKMNIEGAEYKVLDKMLIDNSIDYFNYAIIYSHYKRFPTITTEENHERIMTQVGKRIKINKQKGKLYHEYFKIERKFI